MPKPCPFCGQPMDHPADFKELHVEPHVLNALFTLWRARGRIVIYSNLHENLATAHVYVSKLRIALRDAGVPWIVEVERGIGARLVRIAAEEG